MYIFNERQINSPKIDTEISNWNLTLIITIIITIIIIIIIIILLLVINTKFEEYDPQSFLNATYVVMRKT